MVWRFFMRHDGHVAAVASGSGLFRCPATSPKGWCDHPNFWVFRRGTAKISSNVSWGSNPIPRDFRGFSPDFANSWTYPILNQGFVWGSELCISSWSMLVYISQLYHYINPIASPHYDSVNILYIYIYSSVSLDQCIIYNYIIMYH